MRAVGFRAQSAAAAISATGKMLGNQPLQLAASSSSLASITFTAVEGLPGLHRLGSSAFQLCLATTQPILRVFQLPSGLNTNTSVHVLRNTRMLAVRVSAPWRHRRCFPASFPSVRLQQTEIIQVISLPNSIKFLLSRIPLSSKY